MIEMSVCDFILLSLLVLLFCRRLDVSNAPQFLHEFLQVNLGTLKLLIGAGCLSAYTFAFL